MIDRVLEFSIRRRWLVVGAALLLAVWGVVSARQTPMDAVPDLSENQVIVFTEWAGRSPREIEDQVTSPLVRRLQGLAGLRVARGSSDVGFSMIHLIFEDQVSLSTARARVQERLAQGGHSLPAGVKPGVAAEAIPTGQIFWYTLEGGEYDLARLRSIQDWYVRPQLESVPGVAEVASAGGMVLEYQVEVDLARLQLHGLHPRDVARELAVANAAVGGSVIVKDNSELVVRGVGWLGTRAAPAGNDPRQTVLRDIERTLIPIPGGGAIPLADVARVRLGAQPRRGLLEKDGTEVTGGVVLMRHGDNPLEVTRRLRAKIHEISAGLPQGVRIVVCYDRTPLIEGAVRTVTGTVVEACLSAGLCVMLVLLHVRSALVVIAALPLAALASFVCMRVLELCGIARIQTNIMSLAGIAISIGVLVDSSIVLAENAMVHLRDAFGDAPVRGPTGPIVLQSARSVARPIVFSVLIMLVSFAPVFALSGIDGKMYRPLAFTKVFALGTAALLAITLVPALCTLLIKGRLRQERSSWVVRAVMDVYRPVLNHLLDAPAVLVWLLGATMILAAAALGQQTLFLLVLAAAMVTSGALIAGWPARAAATLAMVLVALASQQWMHPLESELRFPLDEGMVMDMPITVPRASILQSGDDLKARNMVLCRFPEVEMVLGKAGRVESAFDPAPLDMIESMVMLRPPEFWPRRRLAEADFRRHARDVMLALTRSNLLDFPESASPNDLLDSIVMSARPRFDFAMREFCWQRNEEFARGLRHELARQLVEDIVALLARRQHLAAGATKADAHLLASSVLPLVTRQFAFAPVREEVDRLSAAVVERLLDLGRLRAWEPQGGDPAAQRAQQGALRDYDLERVHDGLRRASRAGWASHTELVNHELHARAPMTATRILVEEALRAGTVTDSGLVAVLAQVDRARRGLASPPKPSAQPAHHAAQHAPLPIIDPHPVLDPLVAALAQGLARRLVLWPCDRQELSGSHGGELDSAVAMPGWTNVWTMPIQNRVDMLATGVNSEVGVRVLGQDLDAVVEASEEIANVLRAIPGAVNVLADPVRGKGYLEIRPDPQRAWQRGVSLAEVNEILETALGGVVATWTLEGRSRHAVRVTCPTDVRQDIEALRRLPIPLHSAVGRYAQADAAIPLEEVASIAIVEGPATIKSENGMLRNYVRLNVKGRDPLEFVQEARRRVAQSVRLPEQTFIEWTGQFEHALATRRSMAWLLPVVVALIYALLYWTFRDAADATLMLLAVPGAMAGGVLFQWLFGYKFSMAVGVGYIACFGMAASTGMIMLVYLRQAVERAGGLERLSLSGLRECVLNGAAHRLRPKLLTEATTLLGLAPMLWATGPGADVIRPMAAPVLGGILIADEVVDLLLPILFYQVRKRRWRRLHGAAHPGAARAAADLPTSN